MFRIIVLTAVLGLVLGAPTPYDNPSKSGVLQEISKYHVTAENKEQFAHHTDDHDHKAPVTEKTTEVKKIEGPTPVPVAIQPAVHVNEKREASHTEEHKAEQIKKEEHKVEEPKKKEEEEKPVAKPADFARLPESTKKNKRDTEAVKQQAKPETKPQVNVKPIQRKPEEPKKKDEEKKPVAKPETPKKTKRDTEAAKEQEKPQVAVKPVEHKANAPCDATTCTNKAHVHPQRETTVTSTFTKQIETKAIPAAAAVTTEEKKKEEGTTAKAVVKREDSTTVHPPSSTTVHHLSPTSVHSSFSHTWTRPQANPAHPAAAAAAHQDVKIAAASETKPVVASINPLKPVEEAKKESSSTTVAPPSTTHAAHIQRVRRGVDETEEQDQPKDPKPTKAWWRSLEPKKNEEPKKDLPKKEEEKKSTPVTPAVVAKKDKRETEKTQEEKRPSTGTHVTSTQKPLASEQDSKPPQFVHPVPVEKVLGQKPVEIKHNTHPAGEVHTEEATKEKTAEEHEANHQAVKTQPKKEN